MSTYFRSLLMFILVTTFATSTLAQESNDQSTSITTTQSDKTIKLKVTGITCGGDIKDIQNQVAKMKGVTSCQPAAKPAATSIFEVTYNPAFISEKQIRGAVESTPGCSDPDSRPYKIKG